MPQPYKPQTEMRVSRRHNGWELEFRECGVIPRQGLKGAEGRRLEWECLWRKLALAAMEAGDTAESCVRGGAIIYP